MDVKTCLYILVCALTALSGTAEILRVPGKVKVNKCCEQTELYYEKSCTHINETNETLWQPVFTTERGRTNQQINFILVTGLPNCGSMQQWPIYYYRNSTDVLRLLPNGVLRHYLYHNLAMEEEETESGISVINGKEVMYHDYEPGKYCMDKAVEGKFVSEYAIVCAPETDNPLTSTEFLMRNIVSPVTHSINIACLITVAVVYFVLPTLRDLVGNIVTTISACLIVSQMADLLRLLTVFNNHISIIASDTICYVCLLGAFFWLNSLGYYIWKTFKSRNVFLRITDGKKYCYYSAYAWSCTLLLGLVAVFAHYTMDYQQESARHRSLLEDDQETIGSLAIIIFFVPVSFTVLVDVLFFATTLKTLNRMHTYGRIHHKLKHSFRMFLLLCIILTIMWLFFLLSFSRIDGLIYSYIIVNTLQGPLILYVCVFNQKHVSFLIRKTCCYASCACAGCRPEPECEWGDEMTAMNTGI